VHSRFLDDPGDELRLWIGGENMHDQLTQARSPIVDVLLSKHGGQLIIPFLEAAESLGYKQQTARNELVRGSFPIPTLRRGGRRFVAITDLADYLEQLYATRDLPPPPIKKIGRPSKVEQVAARARGAA
jgi:hypothetical protein